MPIRSRPKVKDIKAGDTVRTRELANMWKRGIIVDSHSSPEMGVVYMVRFDNDDCMWLHEDNVEEV